MWQKIGKGVNRYVKNKKMRQENEELKQENEELKQKLGGILSERKNKKNNRKN